MEISFGDFSISRRGYDYLDLPLRGVIILWLIALLVFGIGISELMIKPWQQD